LEPEHVIDEHATIKGADIEKVYDKCEKWLIEIGANVEKSDKQISIQAIHRKPMDFRWGWIRGSYSSIQRQPSLRVLDMKKIINIEFEKEKDDVILMGLSNEVFAPKTTRHIVKITLEDREVKLEDLL